MTFRTNSTSETFIEMQYLWSIYGPRLVGLSQTFWETELNTQLNANN